MHIGDIAVHAVSWVATTLVKQLSHDVCLSLDHISPITVPQVDFHPSSNHLLPFASLEQINVDPSYADAVDHHGETLIPPTLYQFAETFAADIDDILGSRLPVKLDHPTSNCIFLTVDRDGSRYVDAAGRHTSEGYTLNITSSGVIITGASPLGAWWGTRTLLQLAALHRSGLPLGHTIDSPGWATRGVMLDIGRKFYPEQFLTEMCSFLSAFKQNTFQLHLSDNLVVANTADDDYVQSLYSGFRLRSDDPRVKGLASPANESFTREAYERMQSTCARRGVTLIPEIEAPGHALPLVRWKEELALATDLTMLNISAPATLPSIKSLWSVFLPWFKCKTVHLGADEYNSSFVKDYNDYVNELNRYVASSGKSVRIWGTFPPTPDYSNNIAINVSIQHWEYFEDNPLFDYLNKGYRVVNSDDAFYIVNKYNEGYPTQLDRTKIFHGSPSGGSFSPNIFDMINGTNNPPRSAPGVLGHIAAVWNDNGPNATVTSEAYFAWRDNLPALADKQWGGSLQEYRYEAALEPLLAAVPAQNLDMAVPSTGPTIFHYDLTRDCHDASENGYHATNHGCRFADGSLLLDGTCSLSTGLLRKGRNYTLSFEVKPAAYGGSLFSNEDSALINEHRLTFFAEGFYYPVNYSLPLNEWTAVSLVGQGDSTYIQVKGESLPFLTHMGIAGTRMVWGNMSFPAPLAQIGKGFRGGIRRIELRNDASRT